MKRNKHYNLIDQLWSFDSSTKKLSNKEHSSWLLMDRTWNIPTNGTEGYITDTLSGQVSCLSTFVM